MISELILQRNVMAKAALQVLFSQDCKSVPDLQLKQIPLGVRFIVHDIKIS